MGCAALLAVGGCRGSSRVLDFEAGYAGAQARIFGSIYWESSTELRSIQQLSYELVDSQGVAAWRCTEGRVRVGHAQLCGSFPVPTGRDGVFTLEVHYVLGAGTAGSLTVPMELGGREVSVSVRLAGADGQVSLDELVRTLEAPPGVRLELDTGHDEFRLVNDSAFDLVVRGYGGAFAAYVPLSSDRPRMCGICGTGVHSQLVRRGETASAADPCASETPAGRYAAVVYAHMRAPGLPTAAEPDCSLGCLGPPFSQVDSTELRQLQQIAVWTEFQLDADGHVSAAGAGRSFREWLQREPPTRTWQPPYDD